MLDVNLSYRMPVCLTRKRASQESYETEAMHYDEDYPSICFRIRRFVETQAWAADPPTRVRRFVTSVRAWEGRGRGIFDVTSSLLLVRTSDDDYRPALITAERFDRICRSDERRGGKECVRPCRSRWSPTHEKKN